MWKKNAFFLQILMYIHYQSSFMDIYTEIETCTTV